MRPSSWFDENGNSFERTEYYGFGVLNVNWLSFKPCELSDKTLEPTMLGSFEMSRAPVCDTYQKLTCIRVFYY